MQGIELSWIDLAIIAAYFVMIFIIGYVVKKRIHNVTDYFLAGRRLTLPIFVATLVSTWYGGILGVGELSYNYGIVNWLTQGLFWYISYLIFAFFLAKKVRQSGMFTVPDQFERFYGKKTRVLGAFFNYIMVTPAPYILSLGIIFGLFFGFELWIGVLAGTLLVLFYTIRGGFIADVYTDVLQFALMMIGIAMVIPFAISKFGGFEFLQANLPPLHLTLTGEWTTQMIIVWGFIAFWTLVDPGFYQRCYASKDDKIPKKGILISIAFWMMFDVCTTFIGLYARAAMPNIDPVTSLAVFSASVLPVGLIGLFFAGLLATIMSTVDSFLFLGAMNISHDIYHKTINPNASDEKVIFVTKIAIVFTALASMIMAIYFNSLVSMWYSIGTIGISAMLVPLLAGFFYKGRKSELAALASMSLGALTSFIWLVNGWLNNIDGWAQYLFGIEPMYSGLFVSFAAFAIITLIENRFGNSRIGEKINFGVGT